MFTELTAGGRVVEGRLRVKQEGQFGPIDPGLGGGVLADDPLALGDGLIREGGLVGRRGTRHWAPPFTTHRPLRAPIGPLYHHPMIPTSDCEMDHLVTSNEQ